MQFCGLSLERLVKLVKCTKCCYVPEYDKDSKFTECLCLSLNTRLLSSQRTLGIPQNPQKNTFKRAMIAFFQAISNPYLLDIIQSKN